MPRLTDANALIDDVTERYCKNCERRKGIKNGKQKVIYDIGDAPCRACAVDDMIDELENAPTVEAEPVKHGHWVNHISENGATDGTFCSICDYEIDRDARYNYCPNCGAKMEEEDATETGG